MERLLKVYIYKNGEKPIFHDWILEGIYASEGWFLKLMEANKQFVTEDPNEAHLFYIPFSSRLLQLTLYVPHSHSRDNLIQFMKNHTEMLITKYPFWNRTNGSNHFLAGCHDWVCPSLITWAKKGILVILPTIVLSPFCSLQDFFKRRVF